MKYFNRQRECGRGSRERNREKELSGEMLNQTKFILSTPPKPGQSARQNEDVKLKRSVEGIEYQDMSKYVILWEAFGNDVISIRKLVWQEHVWRKDWSQGDQLSSYFNTTQIRKDLN